MKAALLVGQQQFELRNLDEPTLPEDGLILGVRVCGVCGSDLRRWKEGPGSEPVIPGHEIAGEVLAVGKNCKGYRPGDRLAVAPDVHCGKCYFCRRGFYNLCDDLHLLGITPGYPGGMAEKMVLSGEILTNGIVHPMPARMGFREAALAEPCSSVLAAHTSAGTDPADTVLVMGGGPIGCLHLAVAASRGARTILSEPSEIRRKMAARFNPAAVVDPLNENLLETVRGLTHGRGADVVVCANPVAATQTQAVEVVRKGGRVILFGGLPKANPMTSMDGNRIHYGEIQVVGSFSYAPVFHEIALEMISRNLIPAQDLMTHSYPVEEVNQAFATASSGDALKVMILF